MMYVAVIIISMLLGDNSLPFEPIAEVNKHCDRMAKLLFTIFAAIDRTRAKRHHIADASFRFLLLLLQPVPVDRDSIKQ